MRTSLNKIKARTVLQWSRLLCEVENSLSEETFKQLLD